MEGERQEGNPVKVVLAGPEEGVLIRHAYPAFAAAGFHVLAVVDTPPKLSNILAAASGEERAGLAVIEADIAASADEALALLASLRSTSLAVILPARWNVERERFEKLPNLIAGFVAPVTWPVVASHLAERVAPRDKGTRQIANASAAADSPGQPPHISSPAMSSGGHAASRLPSVRAVRACPSPVRLAFYGTRGGAGTSTAALTAARLLASAGRKVALFDAARRGDLHLMMELTPSPHPVARQGITLFLSPPTEEATWGFDAVVVDGGRERLLFNAEWVPVSKPLSQERLRRLARLPQDEGDKQKEGTGKRKLLGLIQIEVTDD